MVDFSDALATHLHLMREKPVAQSKKPSQGVTLLELAIAISILGVILATSIPACVRTVRVSRTAEAIENSELIMQSALQLRNQSPALVLSSAPLTPSEVPRGTPADAKPELWDHPTWKSLNFSINTSHWFSYQLDVNPTLQIPIRVRALGDLNGDGNTSIFERTSRVDKGKYLAEPGIYVQRELE